MTGRTLDEMHSGYVHALLLSEDDEERYCTHNFKGLLAIAQGQMEEIARLRNFGGKLSNLAFNLKQADSIPDGHRQMLRIAQEDWDNAIGTKK